MVEEFGKLEILQYNFWPLYSIDQRKALLQRLEFLPEEKIPAVAIDLELNNLFLLRRNMDPGFFKFVIGHLAADITPLKKLRKYVKQVFLENVDRLDEELFQIKVPHPTTDLAEVKVDPIITYPTDPPAQVGIKAMKINQAALNLFNIKLKQAIENDDSLEINAIQSIIYEYVVGKYVGYSLFGVISPYQGTSHVERWKFLGRRFITQNIRYESMYYLSSQLSERLFHSYTSSKIIYEYIEDKIVDMVRDEYKGDQRRNLAVENKFHNDIVSIASLLWFQEKNQDEKVEILNAYYPFCIDDAFLEGLIIKNSFRALNHLSHDLYQAGYVEDSLKVNLFHLPKCQDDICRSTCNDNIATAYRDLGDYERALEYYLKSLALLEEIDEDLFQDSREKLKTIENTNLSYNTIRYLQVLPDAVELKHYRIAIERKNVAETYYQLQKNDLAAQYYDQVIEGIDQFTDKGKIAVLLNLAHSYRRIRDYEGEYAYLSRVLEFKPEHLGDRENSVLDRLDLLNQSIEDSSGGKLNTKILIDYDLQRQIALQLDIANRLARSFQFENAIKWYQKSLEFEDSIDILRNLAYTLMVQGQFGSAQPYYETILLRDPTDFGGLFHLSVIHLIQGKWDTGIRYLIQAMRSLPTLEDAPAGFLEHFLAYLLNNGLADRVPEVVMRIAEHPEFLYSKLDFYNDSALELTELGFHSEAQELFEKAVAESASHESKANILNNLGTCFSDQNLHTQALQYYKKAIALYSTNYSFWLNMATSYFYQLNIPQAIEAIDHALELVPGELRSQLEATKKVYEAYNRNVLNLKAIIDEKVKQMLLSAEHLIQEVGDFKVPLDFSFFLVQYAKALETLLEVQIMVPFKTAIHQKYPTGILSNEWGGASTPRYLRRVFERGETISLGTWSLLIDKIHNPYHPIEDELKNYLKTTFTSEELAVIKEGCEALNRYRGGSAHSDVREKPDVLTIRNEIIPHLNKVINLFYK